MKSPKDPEFAAWSRRQFTAATAAGGGALLLGSLWPRWAAAQAKPTGDAGGVRSSERELDALAASEPHLHAVCTDALAQLKYAFAIAASGRYAGAGNEFTDACRSFVSARKPRTKAAYEKGATALLAAPQPAREAQFSHYARIAPATFAATKQDALPRPAKLTKPAKPATAGDLAALSTPSAAVTDRPDPDARKRGAESAAQKAHDEDVAEGKKWKQVEFYISEVKCIENTGGLFEGTDEIAMGGMLVGTTGGMEKIKQFLVKEGFDTDSDSNTKRYKGGRRFGAFAIHPDAAFPHEYVVSLAMAELDDGGFGDFLEALWKKVKGYVTAALAVAGGAIAGAISLSWLPGIGTAIGAIIGAFIGWLVGLFHNDDDIVGHKTSILRLHGISRSYYDKLKLNTPTGIPVTVDFADEGHYRVTGGWRLVAP